MNTAPAAELPSNTNSITLDAKGLAEIFYTSAEGIRTRLCREPHTLPPRIILPGNNRLLWLLSDVVSWLESHREPIQVAPAPKHRGRPTKEKQASRREALLK